MSDINDDTPKSDNQQLPTVVSNPFSNQPTGFVETTFAETLGLSMHNAITNQQSSQMTTSASITNACARLLQAQTPIPKSKKAPVSKAVAEKVVSTDSAEKKESEMNNENESAPKKRFNIMGFFKRKNKNEPEDSGAQNE